MNADRNPHIDGMRGLSVLLVIIGHLVGNRLLAANVDMPVLASGMLPEIAAIQAYGTVALRTLASTLSTLGVNIFFIISGFLITTLLLAEHGQTGRVNLSAFYIRRIFRIIPAFGAYVLCVYLATAAGLIHVANREFLMAASFQCNVPWADCTWWLGHTWSLAVEEQFYLVWPFLFVVTPAPFRTAVAATLLLATSLGALVVPALKSFTPICAGILLASSPLLSAWMQQRCQRAWIANAALALIVLASYVGRSPVLKLVLDLAVPVCLAVVFISLLSGRGLFAPLVQHDAFRRLGLVSYSLYLWQQMFTGRIDYYADAPALSHAVLMIPAALLAWAVVERPSLRLGRQLSAAVQHVGPRRVAGAH